MLSRSNISTLPDDEREAKLAEVVAFYDDFGRGYDGMQLPYVTHCFRARVIDRLGGQAGPGLRRRAGRSAGRRLRQRHAAHRFPLIRQPLGPDMRIAAAVR